MEFSDSLNIKARKEHQCNWCLEPIAIGQFYRKQTIFDDGSAYTWKNHRHCDEIAEALGMFDELQGEGLTQEDFADFISGAYSQIIIGRGLPGFSSTNPMPEFKVRMHVVLKHHKII